MRTYAITNAFGKTKEITVTDIVFETVTELDKRDALNERKETRHCQSLEASIDNGWDIADPNSNVEEIVVRNQRYKALYSALAKLPDEQRELVEKVFFERVPQTEIAKQEGVSRVAIHLRLQVILQKLKKLLS